METENSNNNQAPDATHAHIPSLRELLFAFLRLGLTAFGGPAMIPYVRKMSVEQKKWLDGASFRDGVALCQIIPGATVMQMAAYIGLHVRGIAGACVCYAGFIAPAFIFMLLLSFGYSRTHELPLVISTFSGLQAIIVSVVANATISFGRNTITGSTKILVAAVAAGLLWIMANPVLIIALAALLTIFLDRKKPVAKKVYDQNQIASPFAFSLLVIIAVLLGLGFLFLFRRELFNLAVLMIKIDCLAFGGGFASVPLMFREIVQYHGWMDSPTFLNGIVLGQFTPGPIVITATFVGYMVSGFGGAAAATAGIFLPSFFILINAAPWFGKIRSNPLVMRGIDGILCSFVGLLATVTIRFGSSVTWDLKHAALAVAALTALLCKADILWVVITGSALSILLF